MPRFENEGFSPESNKKRDIDRTVPDDENYYSFSPMDLDFNNKTRSKNDIVRDNQSRGINPTRLNESTNSSTQFRSESAQDFDRGESRHSARERKITSPPPKKQKSKKNGAISVKKKIGIVLLALIVLIVGSVFPVLGRINYDDKKENEYIEGSQLESSAMVKNILLLGVDARSNDEASASRSDTMMLVSLDMKHHCIKLVSFLRDTWVYIPSLGYEQRLNAACSDGGYQNVVNTIEYNFNIDIDSYVVTDFEMFKVLVDSLGGVEVDVTKAEAKEVTGHPKRYGNVTLESGKSTLTGEQALAYCRIRKIDTDFVRTQRQRTVMSAILNKVTHSNPFRLYKMAFNSAPYIETNMSKGELISFVLQAGICVTGGIHQTGVPFDGTWDYATIQGNSVISINTEKNKDKLIDYVYNMSSKDIEAEESKD